jgi:predicted AAA+ superfamily ATPase
MAGAFFETFVISEIIKSYGNMGILDLPIYFYRDRDGNEIDVIIEDGGVLYPIEIKKAASPGSKSVKHFNVLHPVAEPEKFGALGQYKIEVGEGAMICMANDLLPVDRKNWYVPAWLI